MNANTPYLECYVPDSFLYQDSSKSGFTYGYIFGAKSQINQPLRFHVQLETGAVYWSIPIHYLHSRPIPSPKLTLPHLQVWDCQSNHIESSIFTFLKDRRVDIRTFDNQWFRGSYRFTLDNGEGNYDHMTVGYSDHPDTKVYHIIDLEVGRFAAIPNNHLRWHNSDFIKPYDLTNPPKYRSNQELLSCEQANYTTTDQYFYNHEQDTH